MSDKITQRLGILAGEGDLPHRLVAYCQDHNIPVCIVQFESCCYTPFPDIPVFKTAIERVGAIFDFLASQDVTDVVLIGNLKRPALTSLRPDWQGLKTLGRIAGAFAKGDNDLLQSLRHEIERRGYTVRGVDYYLDDLTCAAGTLTQASCQMDISAGIRAALNHGRADKGQSVLFHSDGSLSYEGEEGTNALIRHHGRVGSILIKVIKPQQDPDLDRPTIGLETIKLLVEQKCAGIAIQAREVIFLDRDKAIANADMHGLFIEVFDV